MGERTYDAANALCNPESLPELAENPERLLRQAEILATGLERIPVGRIAWKNTCLFNGLVVRGPPTGIGS